MRKGLEVLNVCDTRVVIDWDDRLVELPIKIDENTAIKIAKYLEKEGYLEELKKD